MPVRQPRYTRDEHARRGAEIYQGVVRPSIDEVADRGKIVAIDVDSEEFVVSDEVLKASHLLTERRPDAQTWFVRIGSPAVHRFGGQLTRPLRRFA